MGRVADRTEKRCPRCVTVKPVEAFARNKSRPDGRNALCKPCLSDWQRARYAANREQWRAYHRDWQRHFRANNPEITRRRYLQREYGMTHADVLAMLETQGGRCGLCGRELKYERGPGRLAVDHDHVTGEIRALLHAKCNIALGVVEDVGAELFAAYLHRHVRLKVV